MKSYDRKPGQGGDGGDTCRFDGGAVRKSDPVVAAAGELDELCAHIGLCQAAETARLAGQPDGQADDISAALGRVQVDLMAAGAMLSACGGKLASPASLGQAEIARMEAEIASVAAGLGRLKLLILPGGCELACRLHVARCVCRRAERAVVAAMDAGRACPAEVLGYLNRLGDLLFELARAANRDAGLEDRTWTS